MELTETLSIIGGSITVLAACIAALLWYIRTAVRDEVGKMKDELRKLVQPIQPGYRNGGESLADVSHMVRRIAEKVGLDNE